MANKRPPWKIPAVIDPPNRKCVQINIPDDLDHIAIFWGALRALSDWQRWEREPTKSATLVAKVWADVVYSIDWESECMNCCGDRIILHRVTDDGALEVSTDGGDTWTTDPADPRIIGTSLPNTIPGEGTDKKCNGATNAISNFKDAQASFAHSLTTSTTVIGLALAIAGELLVLLLSAGTLAEVLVPLIITTATTLFGVAEASYSAEFTEAVWEQLTCDLFCTIGDDGQFTDSQLINLQALVDTHFSDNVALTFQSILRGWGTKGLNNACITGISSTADCSECDCLCQFSVTFESGGWDAYTVAFGTVASNRLDLVAHTYPLGDGTGCEIEIDMMETCLVSTLPFDIQATNTRSGNSVSISWEFFDSTHTTVGSGGGDFSGVADGTLQHLTPTITPTSAQYVVLRVGWLNDPGTNEGWIDNIQINH